MIASQVSTLATRSLRGVWESLARRDVAPIIAIRESVSSFFMAGFK
jgi:hypothetical protein